MKNTLKPEEFQSYLPIASRLRAARGHISQAKAAKRLGVHKNTIGNYERGERLPDVLFFVQMCNLYGVDPNWILLGESENKAIIIDNLEMRKMDLEPVQWLVEDLIEETEVELSGKQKQAVIDVLRKDIFSKAKALTAVVQMKHDGHSILRHKNFLIVCHGLRSKIGFSEDEFEAWLRSHYGVANLNIRKYELSLIAGHLYDLAVEKAGEEAVSHIVFPGLVLKPGDEGYDMDWQK